MRFNSPSMFRIAFAAAWVALLLTSCDSSLEPPEAVGAGALRVTITYAGDWPPEDSLEIAGFAALTFVPQDIQEVVDFAAPAILNPGSDVQEVPFAQVEEGASQQTLLIENVRATTYLYSGVAGFFGGNFINGDNWELLGVYEEGDGTFTVVPDDTVDIALTVDFDNPPPFPPPAAN